MASSSSADAPAPPLVGPSGGRSIILRQSSGHSVEILLYGAQVISWKNERGEENLFRGTNLPNFDPFHPVCGGIQICFPKFLNTENMDPRGFARRSLWSCDLGANQVTDIPAVPVDHIFADFILDHKHIDPTDFASWPNKFEFRLRCILGPTGKLIMVSHIKNLNTNGKSFKFPFSYQNYFSVNDMGGVLIKGLEKKDYLDYMKNKQRCTQGDVAFTFNEAVDRLYPDAPKKITITDNISKRIFTVEKTLGFPNMVVWNPWDDGGDGSLAEVDYRKMVCVEVAAEVKQVYLTADRAWTGIQFLSAKASEDPKEPAT